MAEAKRQIYESERESKRRQSRAYQRTYVQLAKMHRDDFYKLLEVEKAREGIKTLQPRRVEQ